MPTDEYPPMEIYQDKATFNAALQMLLETRRLKNMPNREIRALIRSCAQYFLHMPLSIIDNMEEKLIKLGEDEEAK